MIWHRFSTVLLITISLIGLLLRLSNISPYKFYPDAYQNLIVSESIKNYHSVYGYLGVDGMLYPNFFMWTRPVYALLIHCGTLFNLSAHHSAELISLLSGVLAIPLAYLFLKSLTKSSIIGLSAALLLALSFNHTLWSGFIYTETVAVLITLVFLVLFTARIKKESKIADPLDLLTGAFFALMIFTRYEYLLLGIIFLLITINQKISVKNKVINHILGVLFVSTLFLTQLFPLQNIFSLFFEQSKKLFIISITTLMITLVGFFSIKKMHKEKIDRVIISSIKGLLLTIVILILSQYLFIDTIPLFKELTALRVFATWDFVLMILAITGLYQLLNQKNYFLTFLTLGPVALLWPIYHAINPEMQRYWTHMIPFLLIPSSIALFNILKNLYLYKNHVLKYAFLILIIFVFIFQTHLTVKGMKSWDQGSWYKKSYEESSAQLLKNEISSLPNISNPLLIVSFPESYFYFTHLSTHSIADQHPFLYIDESLDDRQVLVIEDMGMRDLFPNFSASLEKNFSDTVVKSYWVNNKYRFSNYQKPENKPVKIYQTTLKKLKEKL